MSWEAIGWALQQRAPSSSSKFVLVMLANCAPPFDWHAHPSVAYLCAGTQQDRKTIMANLARLEGAGLIERAGRKGKTNQVIEWRLAVPADWDPNSPITGTSTKSGTVPNLSGNSTKSGTSTGTKGGTRNLKGNLRGNRQATSSPPAGLPACPHRELIAVFVAKVPELPKPRVELWSDSKGAADMTQRWKEILTKTREDGTRYATTRDEAVAWFGRFFDAVAESDFLTGRGGKVRFADLAWLMKRENFIKVVHGNYVNREAA